MNLDAKSHEVKNLCLVKQFLHKTLIERIVMNQKIEFVCVKFVCRPS